MFVVKRNQFHKITWYKARLVAQGFSQCPGVDFNELYTPVVRYDLLRLLMALAVKNKWSSMQLDIKAVFLYGNLKEEIYMELPPGYEREF